MTDVWNELLALYDQWKRPRAPASFPIYRRWIQHFSDYCCDRGVLEPSGLTGHLVDAYRQDLAWGPSVNGTLYAPGTVDQCLRVVRSFLEWADKQGYLLQGNPTQHWVLHAAPRVGVRGPIPTAEEVQRMLEVPDLSTPLGLRDRALLEVLYGTALRRHEANQLDLDDLDLAAGYLRVKRGKGGGSRLVPVCANLAEILERYLEESRPRLARPDRPDKAIFLGRRGRRLEAQWMRRATVHYSQQAGLNRPILPHMLRHAWYQIVISS